MMMTLLFFLSFFHFVGLSDSSQFAHDIVLCRFVNYNTPSDYDFLKLKFPVCNMFVRSSD